ncbi:hypothetical protein [Streptomyces sp. ISL-99]|nr:hypothetical protein [Streptomyces sp. ISL-99]
MAPIPDGWRDVDALAHEGADDPASGCEVDRQQACLVLPRWPRR